MKANRFPEHVRESVVRATAGQVFLLVILALVLRSPWIILLLLLDFGLRAFVSPRFSYLAVLSRGLFVPLVGGDGKAIPYPPKRFAATVGFFLSAAAFVLAVAGVPWGFYPALGVLGLFSALESLAGFCAGCAVYGLLMRWGIVPEHSCPQCRMA